MGRNGGRLDDLAWLSQVMGAPVADVRITRYETAGWSGSDSTFSSVEVGIAGGHQRQLVLKTSSWKSDWMMRGTGDRLGRAARVWQLGLLDRVPPEVDHATVAGWVDEDGQQSILMRDAREDLLDGAPHPPEAEQVILDAAAALHAEFFEDQALADPGLGLCSLYDLYRVFAPDVAQTQRRQGASEAADILISGWELLGDLVDPDVRNTVSSLALDPRPLVAALSRFPVTLVHDDLRQANLGIVPGPQPRLLLLDWARAAAAPPAVDLAWHLSAEWYTLPWPREDIIEVYRDALQRRLGPRFDSAWWEPQLRLALLGGAVQYLGFLGWFALHLENDIWRRSGRADLTGWWSEQVRAALPLLADS